LKGKLGIEIWGLKGKFGTETWGSKGKFGTETWGLKGKLGIEIWGLKGEFVTETWGLKGEFGIEIWSMKGKFGIEIWGLKGKFGIETWGLEGKLGIRFLKICTQEFQLRIFGHAHSKHYTLYVIRYNLFPISLHLLVIPHTQVLMTVKGALSGISFWRKALPPSSVLKGKPSK
jgi:hypothetical protein